MTIKKNYLHVFACEKGIEIYSKPINSMALIPRIGEAILVNEPPYRHIVKNVEHDLEQESVIIWV